MLYDAVPPRLSAFDQQVFRVLVPQEHYLSTLLQVVPWDDFHELLAPYYCRDHGRPAESPVLMLKLEYLRYHHNLSDREVIARARRNTSSVEISRATRTPPIDGPQATLSTTTIPLRPVFGS